MAEWDEDVVFGGGRSKRGGGWTGLTTPLKASKLGSVTLSFGSGDRGFRLALLSAALDGMVIEGISITSGPSRFAGSSPEYFIDPVVTGSGIGSVWITSEFGGVGQRLFEVTRGEFICGFACEGFGFLAESVLPAT